MSIEITFRTLKGSTFRLTASKSETILDLKRKVASDEMKHIYAEYILICKGKVLQDSIKISSAHITSSGFVVVIPPSKLFKRRTLKAPPSGHSQNLAVVSSSAPATKGGLDTKTVQCTTSEEGQCSTEPSVSSKKIVSGHMPNEICRSQGSSSSNIPGEANIGSVKRTCHLGDIEGQNKRARHASFGSQEKTEETEGLKDPEIQDGQAVSPIGCVSNESDCHVVPSDSVHSGHAASTGAINENTVVDGSGSVSCPLSYRTGSPNVKPFNMFAYASTLGTGNIDERMIVVGRPRYIREVPLFREIRSLIRSNPFGMREVLDFIDLVYPNVMAVIDRNYMEFMQLIREPLRGCDDLQERAMVQLRRALFLDDDDFVEMAAGNLPPVLLTEEQSDEVMRLEAFAGTIGVPQSFVLHTWRVCNYDEQATAIFLFNHADYFRGNRADGRRGDSGGDSSDDERDNGESS